MKKAGFSCKIRRDHRIQATKGEHGPPAIVMPVANYLFCKKKKSNIKGQWWILFRFDENNKIMGIYPPKTDKDS